MSCCCSGGRRARNPATSTLGRGRRTADRLPLPSDAGTASIRPVHRTLAHRRPGDGISDLNLRLAELLADLEMPGTLLPSVLAAATWDLAINVRSRDYDDRQGLVDFVDALTSDRVERYWHC